MKQRSIPTTSSRRPPLGRPPGASSGWLAATLALAACGESTAVVARPSPPPTEIRPTAEPASAPPGPVLSGDDPGAGDPLADLVAPVRDDEVIEARPTALRESSPAVGVCEEVADAPVRVLPRASAASIIAVGERFYLAAYEPLPGGAEQLSVVELVAGGSPRLVQSIPLTAPVSAERRIAAPALAATGSPGSEGSELGVAFTDATGEVHAAFFDPSRPAATPHPVAAGADLRFSPALARIGPARVVASTIAVEENTRQGDAPRVAMRLHVARLDAQGAVVGRHDVTPLAGAGAHPTFVQTAGGPGDLLFVDARVGLSVIHRVHFDADGLPGETSVARPINLSAEPPSIAAVRLGDRELAAYAATGNMATRAVGLVQLGGTDAPEGLVPGLGYGQPLTVRGVARASDAVFVSEAPSAVPADAPHEVRVRTVRVSEAGARTLGPPLTLVGAVRPAVAVDARGVIAIGLEGGLVRFVRCGS